MARRVAVAATVLMALGALALGQEGARQILVKPLQQGSPGRLEFSVDKGCGAVYRHGEKLQVKVKSARLERGLEVRSKRGEEHVEAGGAGVPPSALAGTPWAHDASLWWEF